MLGGRPQVTLATVSSCYSLVSGYCATHGLFSKDPLGYFMHPLCAKIKTIPEARELGDQVQDSAAYQLCGTDFL